MPIPLPEPIQIALGKKIQGLLGPNSWEPIQRQAASHLQPIGLPGPKTEDYKYSYTSYWLSDLPPVPHQADDHTYDPISPQLTLPATHSPLPTYRIQLINDRLLPAYAETESLPYQVGYFTDPRLSLNELVNNHFYAYNIQQKDPFAVLNTALFNQGTILYIPDGTRLDKPLWIDHFLGPTTSLATHPRLLIWIGKNAHVNLVHHWHRITEEKCFSNSVVELVLAAGANLTYYNLQWGLAETRQINTTYVYQPSNSLSRLYTLTAHSKKVRNNLYCLLQGSASQAHLYGLYSLSGNEQVDNQTVVDHQRPDSTSYELYKGILTDEARGIFNGKIYVQQPAQGTHAFQRNDVLLLSPNATIHTKPQLEIWADDVKCSHGATVGQLDAEALFYLRSRGIAAAQAQEMLTAAFLAEVTHTISPTLLQDYIQNMLST